MNLKEESFSQKEINKEKIKFYRSEITNINSTSSYMKLLFTLILITYIATISLNPFMMFLFTILLTLVTIIFLYNEGYQYQKKESLKDKIFGLLRNPQENSDNNACVNNSGEFWKGVFSFDNSIYLLGFFPLILALINVISIGLF